MPYGEVVDWALISWVAGLAAVCIWLGWRDHARRFAVSEARAHADKARDHYHRAEQEMVKARERQMTKIWNDYMDKVVGQADPRHLAEAIRDVIYAPAQDLPDQPSTPMDGEFDGAFNVNGRPEHFIPSFETEDGWMSNGKEEGEPLPFPDIPNE